MTGRDIHVVNNSYIRRLSFRIVLRFIRAKLSDVADVTSGFEAVAELMLKGIDELKKIVVQYHQGNIDLQDAHHYDFAILYSDQIDYFIFGLNPGETKEDRDRFPGNGHFNPYDPVKYPENMQSRSAKRYISFSEALCGSRNFLISELFFWSSTDLRQLAVRYGAPIEKSPHLPFCFEMNQRLFKIFNPKAVIVLGLNIRRHVLKIKPNLEWVAGEKGVFEHYQDSQDNARPWIFAKHPAARVSTVKRKQISEYLREL